METKEKETEKNYEVQIDTTVSTIEGHVEKQSITGLSGTINKWIDTLENHKELKTISGNLSKLKDAIESKNAGKIVSLLATLGDETSKAAENAKGSEATKIKHLGKALTTASKAVAKFS
jgi:hypothetical protein